MKLLSRKMLKDRKGQKKLSFLCLSLIGIIGWLTIFISFPVLAQTPKENRISLFPSYSVLKTQIAQLAKQIETVQTQQDKLFLSNKNLTDKINITKGRLQKGGNILLELRLQQDLKASREIADQIQTLDKKIYDLTEQSVALKKQLVHTLSVEIDNLSREATNMVDAKQRFQRLERVLQLRKEKEKYQAQITEESNELLLALEVNIATDDGPDDILQKAAIIEDQLDIIRDKERKLDRQIKDAQKELSLRRNMLELLRDIGRGEEDEFDLDRNLRIAELQKDIADIEASLETMQAKKEMWQAKEKALAQKPNQFYQEASKLIKLPFEGDSSEPK